MASRDDIYAAIRKADAAGDAASVQKLVAYLKTMPAGTPSDVHAKNEADTRAWQESINPSEGGGTLRIGGTGDASFDTHIPLPQGITRFLAGAGRGMSDIVRGAGQRIGEAVDAVAPTRPTLSSLITGTQPPSTASSLGLPTSADVAETRRLDAPLMATGAGATGNVVGKVAPALGSIFIPGANTVVGAGLLGAAQGYLEPTTADESAGKNALIGAATGAGSVGVVKGVGALYQAAKAAAQPFYQAGRQVIVGRALNTAAGAEAPQVANQLEQAAAPFVGPSQPGLTRTTMGELVPGSVPSVGEAAGNPGVAALQRAASATTPDVTNQLTALAGTQNAARRNVLEQMAGRGGARDFAAAERDATAEQLYGAARRNGIDPAALTPEAQANIAAMQARIPPDVLAQAQQLAKIQGMPMTNDTALSGMHYVKQALDDAISAAKATGNATKARALTGLQHDYLSGMDQLSPDYAAARSVYADMSRPINQMDTAGAVLDKSANPLTGTIQPQAYARALTDKTAASATGFPGATLENTLTGPQQNLLQSILEDVQRSHAAQNAGRGAGSDTVQKLAYANILDQSGVPTFMRVAGGVPFIGSGLQVAGNVLGRGADVAYGRANNELASQLAQTMLSPADAAAAMGAATREDTPNALLRLLRPYLLNSSRLGSMALTAGSQQ